MRDSADDIVGITKMSRTGFSTGRGNALPFTAAVEHFADVLADMARPFGIGFQAARHIGMLERFFNAQKNWFGGEQPFLDADGFTERVAMMLRRDGHDAQQRAPIDRAAARQVAGPGVEQAQFVGGDQHEAGFIEAAASGAAEHLKDFIGLKRLFLLIAAIGSAGEGDAAKREIDAGGQAHRRHHDAKLAGFGQRFDDARARAVAQAAVMIGNAAFEKLGEMIAREQLLFGAELKRIGRGQIAGKFGGHGFGGLAARGKDQNGTEIFGERFGGEPRPVTANFARHMEVQIVRVHFLQRHRAMVVADQNGGAAQAVQPFDHVLRIGHAAAEQQKLGLRRSESEGKFVIKSAVGVADHLVFVHDEQGGAVALDEAVLLRLQRGDENRGVQVFRKVAGGDADIPAAGAPFRQFVIGERAGGNGVDGLAAVFAAVGPKLKNQGLARAGGSLDDDVLAFAQSGDGLLLPEVRDGDLIEGGMGRQLFGER